MQLAPFGCFVAVTPTKQGLVHVSELDVEFVENVADRFSVGDVMDVMLVDILDRGKLKLSRKQALSAGQAQASAE